jgi:hypothetical protein
MRSDGIVHHKLPPGTAISTRQPVNPRTPDKERPAPEDFQEKGLLALAEQIGNMARQIENMSNPVDEYNAASVSGAGSSVVVTVQPTYEYMSEKITSVIVTGPSGIIKLQLGDRIWTLTIPASGILVIAPLALLLDRTDDRVLTPVTPGAYTLELMGIADTRFAS